MFLKGPSISYVIRGNGVFEQIYISIPPYPLLDTRPRVEGLSKAAI